MKASSGSVIAGVTIGAVAGTVTYMMTSKKKSAIKTVKKNTGKALKTVGGIMENMSYMCK